MFSLSIIAAAAALLKVASATDVMAHFMVQNAYAYDVAMWKLDMTSAQQVGIDGFALNWIPPDCVSGLDWTVATIDDAFTAAAEMGFKLMHSFDMSYSTCNVYWNQTFMQEIIARNAANSATYRWNSNILISTYGGDQVEQYGNEFFQGLKDNMKYSNPISIAPGLTTYSMGAQYNAATEAAQLMTDYPSIDGFLNWQAWPLNVLANLTVTPDQAFQAALKTAGRSGPYIMAISPWQYKDLNDGNPLDSWVAYSDTLFPDRFTSLVSNDAVQPDIIELLTWNDFCESHYIRDLPSQDITAKDYVELGSMGAYVYGQNHAPWRIIAKYYISWWKTGSPPAITMDQVVFWHRVHPKATVCTGGSSTAVRNALLPVDAVFAWALVTAKSTISMTVGSNEYWTFEANNTGPSMNMVPFPAYVSSTGITPEVAIMRDGLTVQWAQSTQPISTNCAWQNFNPVVSLAGPGINAGSD